MFDVAHNTTMAMCTIIKCMCRGLWVAGESVMVTDGPFSDMIGIVDGIDVDKGRVRVLVSMFGRETPVELDFLQVEKQ